MTRLFARRRAARGRCLSDRARELLSVLGGVAVLVLCAWSVVGGGHG